MLEHKYPGAVTQDCNGRTSCGQWGGTMQELVYCETRYMLAGLGSCDEGIPSLRTCRRVPMPSRPTHLEGTKANNGSGFLYLYKGETGAQREKVTDLRPQGEVPTKPGLELRSLPSLPGLLPVQPFMAQDQWDSTSHVRTYSPVKVTRSSSSPLSSPPKPFYPLLGCRSLILTPWMAPRKRTASM